MLIFVWCCDNNNDDDDVQFNVEVDVENDRLNKFELGLPGYVNVCVHMCAYVCRSSRELSN